jgi:hypothetical protein
MSCFVKGYATPITGECFRVLLSSAVYKAFAGEFSIQANFCCGCYIFAAPLESLAATAWTQPMHLLNASFSFSFFSSSQWRFLTSAGW